MAKTDFMTESVPAPDLSFWRRLIDSTDESLLGLIGERMDCVRKVAEAKQSEAGDTSGPVTYFRPGREAQMMRDLAAKADAIHFPAAALIQIWRELISASIAHQAGALTVAVTDEAGAGLARAHFGAVAQISRADTAQMLKTLQDHSVMVAVLPVADATQIARADGIYAIGALPFLLPDDGAEITHLLVAAQLPEASGDDQLLMQDGNALTAVPGTPSAQSADNPSYLGAYATPLRPAETEKPDA